MTTIATECPVCPEGIVRCAHLGDRVVWLGDSYAAVPHADVSWLGERWAIAGPSVPEQCSCAADHTVAEIINPRLTDSLPDAEAEYERRCALLRAEA